MNRGRRKLTNENVIKLTNENVINEQGKKKADQ